MILEFTAEQTAFQQEIEAFARDVVAFRAAGIDKSGEFPTDVIHAAAQHGLCGVTIPKQWGGAGRDYVSYALAIEAVARASATVAVSLSVTNSLVAEVIAHAGRDQQRERWLRPLAAGDAIGAFALSEPDAGTDAANQQTKAVQSGGGYRIAGDDRGRDHRHPTLLSTDARAGAAGPRPGIHHRRGSYRSEPTQNPGTPHHAQHCESANRGCLDLELDILVSDDQVLGQVDQGFRLAMWALQGGRVAIAAQALGIGRAALDEAIAYAKQREQFGQPIANYQAIQWMLADMATELAAARMLTLKAAAAKETQERSTVEASMAKLAASEAAHKAADKAMQILASAGYRRGSVVERLFRDVRATEIYQGTSEAQRMIIAANVLAGG